MKLFPLLTAVQDEEDYTSAQAIIEPQPRPLVLHPFLYASHSASVANVTGASEHLAVEQLVGVSV